MSIQFASLVEETIHTLFFAAGQIVMAQDADDMEYATHKLIEVYPKWETEVTENKEYMRIGGVQKDLVPAMDRGLAVATTTNIWDCSSRKMVYWMKPCDSGTLRQEKPLHI